MGTQEGKAGRVREVSAMKNCKQQAELTQKEAGYWTWKSLGAGLCRVNSCTLDARSETARLNVLSNEFFYLKKTKQNKTLSLFIPLCV